MASVPEALAQLRVGRPVLVVDDEHRENEGDVVLAAEHATPEWVGWTVRHTSGLLCAPMPAETADRLRLPAMVTDNEDPRGTAYTLTVDARDGVTTGISAADRARTLRLLASATTTADELVRPGHVLPLRARPGGVLERAGHTEASVDLCRLAGLMPVAVIAELVHDDGSMMRLPDVLALGAAHDLVTVSIADLALWRLTHDDAVPSAPAQVAAPRVQHVASTTLPTRHGTFVARGYRDLLTGAEHVALVSGDLTGPDAVVRLHSECLTGDVLGSLRCDCGAQLDAALEQVARRGGAVVYLRGHEGRGVGLLAKLSAYALQDLGRDTVDANLELGLPADAREYGAAAAILADLGVSQVRLLTNNPAKVEGLAAHGVAVVGRTPLRAGESVFNARYLATKRDRMGHDLGPQRGQDGSPSSTAAQRRPA
ncbi:bifunctional 3,4-dihydroxy-2-butanone-4-phosphate synthase/GTP cyclohydrolase II [Angustibacter sp. Root456]|uniref:bifunctional 3,4-dihydroxy-2-butanone-4-phosphate synthase/GTP cyclohydrolase II n=1 Tax=Angustibacter sp. Root456 TaxID=1736539 RepID=UPI0006F2A8EC|nr:GTP cyclohydrolase [Angustibacter sp. Root456]